MAANGETSMNNLSTETGDRVLPMDPISQEPISGFCRLGYMAWKTFDGWKQKCEESATYVKFAIEKIDSFARYVSVMVCDITNIDQIIKEFQLRIEEVKSQEFKDKLYAKLAELQDLKAIFHGVKESKGVVEDAKNNKEVTEEAAPKEEEPKVEEKKEEEPKAEEQPARKPSVKVDEIIPKVDDLVDADDNTAAEGESPAYEEEQPSL